MTQQSFTHALPKVASPQAAMAQPAMTQAEVAQQQQQQQQLLQQLRDIHLPDPVSAWPPAIGWWLLLAVGLAALALLIRKISAYRQNNKFRKVALQQLQVFEAEFQQQQNVQHYLQNANSVLRRILLQTSSLPELTSKSGAGWSETLRNSSRYELDENALFWLSTGCYQAEPDTDVASLHAQIVDWVKQYQPAAKQREKLKTANEAPHV